jgi:SynChlorMet cassette protein ScmC
MELEADGSGNGSRFPGLFFVPRQPAKDGQARPARPTASPVADFPGDGWQPRDLRSVKFWYREGRLDVVAQIGRDRIHEMDIIRMWTSLYPVYLRVQDSGGLPVHAALVEREGKGILLAGPGNSGKSTACCRLAPPWHTLSDDQALVVRSNRKGYLVHPLPTWSDYIHRRTRGTWAVERFVPLAAVFFLEQAGADQAVPLGRERAAALFYRRSAEVWHSLWARQPEEANSLKRRTFDNACQVALHIPAYTLRVSLAGRFWEKIEGEIKF